MVSEAQKRATSKYQAANRRRFQVVVNRKNEADILKWLEETPNVSGYIKYLIRQDMHRYSLMDCSPEFLEMKYYECPPPF